MRKTCFILILLFAFLDISEAQNYKFDKLVNSTFITESRPDRPQIHFFNSNDFSYFLELYRTKDSLKSRIFDIESKFTHLFYVDEKDSMKFHYLKSWKSLAVDKNYYFDFSEIVTKGKRKEVLLKILNNRKRKIGRYKFEVKETELNLFPIFKLTATELYFNTKIDVPQNFLVLKARARNTSGNLIKYSLDSIQDVDLKITVPKT